MVTGARTGGRCLQLNVVHLPLSHLDRTRRRFDQHMATRYSCVWLTTAKGVFRFGVTDDFQLQLKPDDVATRLLPRASLHLDVPAWRRPWRAAFQVRERTQPVTPIPRETDHGFSPRLIHLGDRLWVFSGLAIHGSNLGIIERIEVIQDDVPLDSESHLRDEPGLLPCD